jgi:hypothetical protein
MLLFELVVRIVGVYFSIGLTVHLIICTILATFDSDRDRNFGFKELWLEAFKSHEFLVSDIVLWPETVRDICKGLSTAMVEDDTKTDDSLKTGTESTKGE